MSVGKCPGGLCPRTQSITLYTLQIFLSNIYAVFPHNFSKFPQNLPTVLSTYPNSK